MVVKRLVVHLLQKDEGKTKAQVEYSRKLLPLDERSNELIQKLDTNYRHASIIYAELDFNHHYTFPSEFLKYLETDTDDSFLSFSTEAMNDLRSRVESTQAAKGGFLVFAQYEDDDEKEFISVYLIRDTQGMLFERLAGTSSFSISTITHLDLGNLAMACRINLTSYQQAGGTYLGFIKRKMERISDYFINWVTAVNQESNKIFTKKLFDLVSESKLPLTQNGREMTRDEFREIVFDYVKTSSSNVVDLKRLSAHFYRDQNGEPDESYLTNLAGELELTINTIFQADTREMASFVRVDLATQDIHLRFSRKQIDERIVRIDETNLDLVIIESRQLADSLREQIGNDGQSR